VNEPSTNDSFPIHPTGPDGLLFEGPAYRYTFVAPLVDAPDPMAIARRSPLKGEDPPRLVILKRVEVPPEEERRQRAMEEVQLASCLRHPNIAEVYGLEEYQGAPYVVMAYAQGIFLNTAMETALLLGRTLSPPSPSTSLTSWPMHSTTPGPRARTMMTDPCVSSTER
jgi:serine/threonine-protein kinase